MIVIHHTTYEKNPLIFVVLLLSCLLAVPPVSGYTIDTNMDGFIDGFIDGLENSILSPDYPASAKLEFMIDVPTYNSFVNKNGDNLIDSISYTLTYPPKSSETATKGINQYATITFDQSDFDTNHTKGYGNKIVYVAKPYQILPDPTNIIQIDCDVKIKCWFHRWSGAYFSTHTHHITTIPDTTSLKPVNQGTRMVIGFDNVYHAWQSDDTTIQFNDTITVVESGTFESTAYVDYRKH
jgi:hypothetical protein